MPARRWHLSYLVLLLVIPMLYLGGIGPAAYVIVRKYGDQNGSVQLSPAIERAILLAFEPASALAANLDPYRRYVQWFVGRARTVNKAIDSE